MKRRVYVRPRIRHHLDPADMKLRPFGIMLARCLAAEKVGDHRRGQPPVSNHAVFHVVAHIDERWVIMLDCRHIFPAFQSATRFSKRLVSALSALPRWIACSATARASSLRPAAYSSCALVA